MYDIKTMVDFMMNKNYNPYWYKQYAYIRRKKFKYWQKNHNKKTIKKRKK